MRKRKHSGLQFESDKENSRSSRHRKEVSYRPALIPELDNSDQENYRSNGHSAENFRGSSCKVQTSENDKEEEDESELSEVENIEDESGTDLTEAVAGKSEVEDLCQEKATIELSSELTPVVHSEDGQVFGGDEESELEEPKDYHRTSESPVNQNQGSSYRTSRRAAARSVDYTHQLAPKNLTQVLNKKILEENGFYVRNSESDSRDSDESSDNRYRSNLFTRSQRSTHTRKYSRPSRESENPRLRDIEKPNYELQLMPKNLTQMLDRDFPLNSITPIKKPKRKKIHESEDEIVQKPKSRILTMMTSNKPQGCLPMNMKQMMASEENNLLSLVDEGTRVKFLQYKNKSVGDFDGGFEMVAGFEEHIKSLKEMVGLPLMYPELFESFDIKPPKGVLFHGPPGTGKTLMARALSQSCSKNGRPVAFFMRKGADILSKWVGESEKQLRLLFETAKLWEPSIIFFDEIDGLCPTRTSKQDQIHASIVSTLLSLMDGLDDRGQVVVIGATNRIDSIDPALRRPGRFDREFFFGLPDQPARLKIIENTTKKWTPGLDTETIDILSKMTHGYNGADVKMLCTEAALNATRRSFPQIYENDRPLVIDVAEITVTENDFIECMQKTLPSTERSETNTAKAIPDELVPLLRNSIEIIEKWLKNVIKLIERSKSTGQGVKIQDFFRQFSPKLALYGPSGMGQAKLGSHAISILQQHKFYCRTLDITSFVSSHENIDSIILTCFGELKRHDKVCVYFQNIDQYWDELSKQTQDLICNLLQRGRVLIIVSMDCELVDFPQELLPLFPKPSGITSKNYDWNKIQRISSPSFECLKEYFTQTLQAITRKQPTPKLSLPKTLALKKDLGRKLPAKELEELLTEYKSHQLKLRLVFGEILTILKKQSKALVNIDTFNLLEMDQKLAQNKYETPENLLTDIELIKLMCDQDLKPKAGLLYDQALEQVESLTDEFRDSCWYFYLFKRSNLLHQEYIDSSDTDDSVSDGGNEDVEVVENDMDVAFSPQVDMTVSDLDLHYSDANVDDKVETSLDDDELELLARRLATRAKDVNLNEINDMTVSLVGYCVLNDNLSLADFFNEFCG